MTMPTPSFTRGSGTPVRTPSSNTNRVGKSGSSRPSSGQKQSRERHNISRTHSNSPGGNISSSNISSGSRVRSDESHGTNANGREGQEGGGQYKFKSELMRAVLNQYEGVQQSIR